MSSPSPETKYYHHGRFTFSGGTLPDAFTAYRTYGNSQNPCIVFPTCYGGRLDSQLYLIGEDKVLKPSKYFIVTFALFSNGESSSPSNTPIPYNGPYFPMVTYEDNIRAQYAVLTKELNVQKIFCVIGFSMGGQQAYHWPVMFPDFVERFIPICGSARTSPHNICFLEGPKAALVASQDFQGGHYTTKPAHGIRAFGRVYSAWAYGQTWFRNKSYLYDGKYTDLDDFLRSEWETGYLTYWDANDMLTLLKTWQLGDISRVKAVGPSLQGDLVGVLSSITAKGLIMPCKTDLYFPPEDSENEVQSLTNSTLVVIPSVWGHKAGGGSNEEDNQFIYKVVGEFLES
ncbi:alpha beta hydrolase fold protein [Irpex rosettiformis]|uniref:Alpha beta hydrolase fold protein n=1 Tax=Irpex rosettiformis TaxID=378272 RepID=A0ACB8TS70_9APHY|nr:alpha beta hydrolase fold protein [Irpex rosettiformis]